jgi:uncharacterized protein (DUF169 family)
MDWAKVSADLRRYTNLATDPVGVRMVRTSKELIEIEDAKLLTKTALCQMALMARYYKEEGITAAAAEGIKCVWGASAVGMMRSPERLSRGDLYMQFVADQDAARRMHSAIGMMGDDERSYAGIHFAPLGLMTPDPDAIVMYVTPAQALRLIIGMLYKEGGAIRTEITGQASLCASIARAVRDKEMSIDIPCVGDRSYGLVTENEMLVAFPPEKVEDLLEGLRRTEHTASHPFKPFVRWPVVFPLPFEPQRHELE